MSEKHYHARIVYRRDLSEDLWLICVEPGGPFRFVAGQYATLGVERNGKRIERTYSIVSSPYERTVEFFIELVPQGELTPHLHKLQKGDSVSFRREAKGRFTLDFQSGRTQHLLLCTVTGIGPFVSYVRTLYRDWKNGQIPGGHRLYIVHGASRSWELGYCEEMERYAAEVPWLKYVATVSRPWQDNAWTGETGRVDDLIRKYTDQWQLSPEQTTAYLCGHPQMVENGRGILTQGGWHAVREEIYFTRRKHRESGRRR